MHCIKTAPIDATNATRLMRIVSLSRVVVQKPQPCLSMQVDSSCKLERLLLQQFADETHFCCSFCRFLFIMLYRACLSLPSDKSSERNDEPNIAPVVDSWASNSLTQPEDIDLSFVRAPWNNTGLVTALAIHYRAAKPVAR